MHGPGTGIPHGCPVWAEGFPFQVSGKMAAERGARPMAAALAVMATRSPLGTFLFLPPRPPSHPRGARRSLKLSKP